MQNLNDLEISLYKHQLDELIKKGKTKKSLENWLLNLIHKKFHISENPDEEECKKINAVYELILRGFDNYTGIRTISLQIKDYLQDVQLIMFQKRKIHFFKNFLINQKIFIHNFEDLEYVNEIYQKNIKIFDKVLFISFFISKFSMDYLNEYFMKEHILKNYPLLAQCKKFNFGLYNYDTDGIKTNEKKLKEEIQEIKNILNI